MSDPIGTGFLDVSSLLEQSHPRGPVVRLWQGVAVFFIIVLGSAWLGSRGGQMAKLVNVLSVLAMLGLMGAMAMMTYAAWRAARAEQVMLQGIEELIRLRRWPEASVMLGSMLSQPARTAGARMQGLIFLTSVLARYNRFEDAIAVQNDLLEDGSLDPGTAYGLRLARAMAMLREDHLVDADRAMGELRRQVTRAGRESSDAASQPISSGLALIEIYRDVKTGHPAEAIELFDAHLPALRDQLGHRVADVYALVARAYDMLGREAEAQMAYAKATLLSPAIELHRRYPETAALATKYQPASAPREAA